MINKIFFILCMFIIVVVGVGVIENIKADKACKAMGYDYGSVNYNPKKHYICKNVTRYWFEDNKLEEIVDD